MWRVTHRGTVFGSPYRDEWRDELLANVGARIRELRELCGIPLRRFAEQHVHMAEAQLSRIEHGKSNVTVVVLERIARALGVDLYEFLVPAEKSDVLERGALDAPPKPRKKRSTTLPEERDTSALLPAVGGRIRELRDLQGLSLSVLGEFLDMDQTQLSRIERGKHNLSLVFADRIARGLRVELHELFVPVEKSDVLPRADRRPSEAARRNGSRVRGAIRGR